MVEASSAAAPPEEKAEPIPEAEFSIIAKPAPCARAAPRILAAIKEHMIFEFRIGILALQL
jgi:hypothetical protein